MMEETVENFLMRYESALAAQDWPVVSPLIHQDACVTFSDGTVHLGKAQVRRAFERNFSLIENEEYRISALHWVTKAELFAVCLFDFYWRGRVRGRFESGSGRGTMVLLKEDGAWCLIAEHLGTN